MENDLKHIAKQIGVEQLKDKSVLLIGSRGFIGNWLKDLFDYYSINYLG